MTFNLNDYKGEYVMRCKTKEEAESFCRFLHQNGRKWSSGDSYLESADGTYIKQTQYITSTKVCIVMLRLPSGNATQYLNGAILWKTRNLATEI